MPQVFFQAALLAVLWAAIVERNAVVPPPEKKSAGNARLTHLQKILTFMEHPANDATATRR
jgi:hypothetical protein